MGLDLSNVTLPQWFTSAIGLVVIALIWRAVCAASDELIRRSFPKRRTGTRTDDDSFGKHERSEWMDRLIDSMAASAEVNTEVARSLAVLVVQQKEMGSKVDLILHKLQLRPEGA